MGPLKYNPKCKLCKKAKEEIILAYIEYAQNWLYEQTEVN